MPLNYQFLHNDKKGCKLVAAHKVVGKYKCRGKKLERTLFFLMCLTHGVDVCESCGWEFGQHPVSQTPPFHTKAELTVLKIKRDIEKNKTIVQPA